MREQVCNLLRAGVHCLLISPVFFFQIHLIQLHAGIEYDIDMQCKERKDLKPCLQIASTTCSQPVLKECSSITSHLALGSKFVNTGNLRPTDFFYSSEVDLA